MNWRVLWLFRRLRDWFFFFIYSLNLLNFVFLLNSDFCNYLLFLNYWLFWLGDFLVIVIAFGLFFCLEICSFLIRGSHLVLLLGFCFRDGNLFVLRSFLFEVFWLLSDSFSVLVNLSVGSFIWWNNWRFFYSVLNCDFFFGLTNWFLLLLISLFDNVLVIISMFFNNIDRFDWIFFCFFNRDLLYLFFMIFYLLLFFHFILFYCFWLIHLYYLFVRLFNFFLIMNAFLIIDFDLIRLRFFFMLVFFLYFFCVYLYLFCLCNSDRGFNMLMFIVVNLFNFFLLNMNNLYLLLILYLYFLWFAFHYWLYLENLLLRHLFRLILHLISFINLLFLNSLCGNSMDDLLFLKRFLLNYCLIQSTSILFLLFDLFYFLCLNHFMIDCFFILNLLNFVDYLWLFFMLLHRLFL